MNDRLLYTNDQLGLWIKVWAPEYIRNLKLCRSGNFELLRPDGSNNTMHGIELKFFTPENSAAFDDYIYDRNGVVRGYSTYHGIMPEYIPSDFTISNAEKMLRLGWAMSDYCSMNVIMVDGVPSFIDYDTYFTSLTDINVEFETEFGCLRSHVDPLFRSMILSNL